MKLHAKQITVSTQEELTKLVENFKSGRKFVIQVSFSNGICLYDFLKEVDIPDFKDRYYVNQEKNIHIAICSEYVHISTAGLATFSHQDADDNYINAYLSQSRVMMILLEKICDLMCDTSVYDIESHSYGILSELALSLTHNSTFYIEIL